MSINAKFDNRQPTSYLKPYVAIDCFLGDLALKPKTSQITSLIKLTLGEECNHTIFPVTCVALDETAAEKWVALTRRVADSQFNSRQSDKNLVRHIYDLYHLKSSGLLTGEYCSIVSGIIENDRNRYKKTNTAFALNPLGTIELALDQLFKDHRWHDHWDLFLENMVYGESKPNYVTAFNQIQLISTEIFNAMKDLQK